MSFQATLINILILLALTLPGFILRKSKLVSNKALPTMSVLLLYGSQPFLTIYSFQKIVYSKQLFINLSIVAGVTTLATVVLTIIAFIVFHKNIKEDTKKRVLLYAATCGNYGFMGMPVLQVLFPNNPEAIIYSSVCVVVLNIFSWTMGAYLVSKDKKYISIKKALLNPQALALLVAIPMFIAHYTMPQQVLKGMCYMGNMTIPLSMTVLGMRFSDVKFKEFFTNFRVYIAIFIKLIISPLIMYVILLIPMPIDYVTKASLVILFGMPTGIIVLSISECFGAEPREETAKTAAIVVLFGSLLSGITVPLISLLL